MRMICNTAPRFDLPAVRRDAAAKHGRIVMAYEAGDYEAITLERRGAVAILTLNRPDRLNAISTGLRDEGDPGGRGGDGRRRGPRPGADRRRPRLLRRRGPAGDRPGRHGTPDRTDQPGGAAGRDGLGRPLGHDVVGPRQAGHRRDQRRRGRGGPVDGARLRRPHRLRARPFQERLRRAVAVAGQRPELLPAPHRGLCGGGRPDLHQPRGGGRRGPAPGPAEPAGPGGPGCWTPRWPMPRR